MSKALPWLALGLFFAICTLFPINYARPADEYVPTARFFCFEEKDANAIAEKLKDSDPDGDVVAKAFMATGQCVLLPVDFTVHVTKHGQQFHGKNANIEVVGFSNAHEGGDHDTLYAMLWLDAIEAAKKEGTI